MTLRSGQGGALRDRARPPSNRPPARPWRSLLICAALVALTLAVLRDLGLTDPRALLAAPVGSAESGSPLLDRIASDPVRLIFVALCGVMALFALVQVVMLAIEAQVVRAARPASGALTLPAQLVRLLAGRALHPGHPETRRLDALALADEGDSLSDPLRTGLTAFPMLGFLGTVVGLSGAIESLPSAIGNPDALQPVLSDLHVAFDTTLIGLAGALVCLVGARIVDLGWERVARHAGAR